MAKKEYLAPLGVHVLVSPLPPDDDWVLAGKAKNKPEKGILVEVGENVESERLRDAKDKVVLYRQYSQEVFKVGGEEYFLIEEADIMGIWHK